MSVSRLRRRASDRLASRERGLEGVLGILGVAEQPATDAQHHRPVATHERGKGGLVTADDERLEKVAVRRTVPGIDEGLTQSPEHGGQDAGRHVRLPLLLAGGESLRRTF
jgi:hypothetical protein